MSELTKCMERFSDSRLVVVGDLVADLYINGTTSRISREAPVLIVREESCEVRPGGAGNVTANIKSMGGQAILVGIVGPDETGRQVVEKLEGTGISCEGIVFDTSRITTTKTRILAGGLHTVRQQMLRLDRVNQEPISERIGRRLVNLLEKRVRDADALVVSDYGEGVVSDRVFEKILEIADNSCLPVFVDSRSKIDKFVEVEALTPNEPELQATTNLTIGDPVNFEKAGRRLLAKTKSEYVLVKRGKEGMALFEKGRKTKHIVAYGSGEVADVTGAGDTVLAAFCLARSALGTPLQAMRIANTAAGIKITKSGTAVVTDSELYQALEG